MCDSIARVTMPVVLLTAILVKNTTCPIGKGKQDLFDTQCKGLLLEIRASGGKTWYLRYSDHRGRQRQLKLADLRDLDLRQARNKANQLRRQIALGAAPAEDRTAARSVPTFKAYMQDTYMPFARAYKRSWKNDISYLKVHLYTAFGAKYLDEITKTDVLKFHNDMRQRGYAPATANRSLGLLSNAFNRAIGWGTPGVTKNPTKGVPMFEENNLIERFLSEADVKRLYRALVDSRNTQLKYIVPMLILSGTRKREVLDAVWADVDIPRRMWRIPMSKSGRARHVPISDGLAELLLRIPRTDGNPFIVPDPKTGKAYISLQYFWNMARCEAGMPQLRIHDLRHSFASFLINAGRSLYEVQKILGHSQIKTTQRYAHLTETTLVDAANAAGDAIKNAFGGPQNK